MTAPDDSGRSDQMLLQFAAGLIVFSPILMLAAREIPATILVIVFLSLTAVAVRAGNTRAILDDLGYGMRMPVGLIIIGLVGLMFLSLTWAPLTERAARHLRWTPSVGQFLG